LELFVKAIYLLNFYSGSSVSGYSVDYFHKIPERNNSVIMQLGPTSTVICKHLAFKGAPTAMITNSNCNV